MKTYTAFEMHTCRPVCFRLACYMDIRYTSMPYEHVHGKFNLILHIYELSFNFLHETVDHSYNKFSIRSEVGRLQLTDRTNPPTELFLHTQILCSWTHFIFFCNLLLQLKYKKPLGKDYSCWHNITNHIRNAYSLREQYVDNSRIQVRVDQEEQVYSKLKVQMKHL